MKKSQLWKDQGITHRFLRTEELSRPTNEPSLPLVIESAIPRNFDFLHDFAIHNKSVLRQLLAKHGALLFRGFDIITPEQFEAIMSTLTTHLAENYAGIAPRKHVTDHVFTSTEATDAAILAPHSEMAYSYKRPGVLGFYCQVAPSKYGETPLYNCRSVYESLSQECLDLLEKGIQYVRYHPKKWSKYFFKTGSTWPYCFSTEDKKSVEKALKKEKFRYEWDKKETLKITTHPPAITTHPLTKKKCTNLLLSHYINYSRTFDLFKERYSTVSRYMIKAITALITVKGKENGPTKMYSHDGSPIPDHIMKELHQAYWNHSVIFPWQQNDVLVVDNIICAHGRMNVIAPRKILVCLGDEYSVDGT